MYRDDEGSLASGRVDKGTSSAAGVQGKMGLRLGCEQGKVSQCDIYGGSLRINKAGGTSGKGNCRYESPMRRPDPREREE